jgi:hypothetical protein
MAMIAITTSNSMRVKPPIPREPVSFRELILGGKLFIYFLRLCERWPGVKLPAIHSIV